MKILAISGGPDSMFLLNEYKRSKNVIVCHVNYNKRKDSKKDEQIVKNFCKKHNIKLKVLNVKKEVKGNFQNEARKIRYNFFKKHYDQHGCKKLLMAHHKDDFLETALMQLESKRNPRFFGIRSKNTIDGMKIKRPYVNLYWKKDILQFLKKNNVKYAIDSSNEKPVFERNKIRIKLKKKTLFEKENLYKWFLRSNKILKKKFKKVDRLYIFWLKNSYDLNVFRKLKYKNEIIYILINEKFKNIKLSSKKIQSLVNFLTSESGGKNFKLNDKVSISKKGPKILGI